MGVFLGVFYAWAKWESNAKKAQKSLTAHKVWGILRPETEG
jgi:hypothetical protein